MSSVKAGTASAAYAIKRGITFVSAQLTRGSWVTLRGSSFALRRSTGQSVTRRADAEPVQRRVDMATHSSLKEPVPLGSCRGVQRARSSCTRRQLPRVPHDNWARPRGNSTTNPATTSAK
jgi:hypothetical protein